MREFQPVLSTNHCVMMVKFKNDGQLGNSTTMLYVCITFCSDVL